jgi:hypothetical protein
MNRFYQNIAAFLLFLCGAVGLGLISGADLSLLEKTFSTLACGVSAFLGAAVIADDVAQRFRSE